MIEFVTNNNELISIELSIVFIIKDLYLHLSYNIIDIFDAYTCEYILR